MEKPRYQNLPEDTAENQEEIKHSCSPDRDPNSGLHKCKAEELNTAFRNLHYEFCKAALKQKGNSLH